MFCEVNCEQIYPSLKDRPAICGLCGIVPEARGQICQARSILDLALKGVIGLISNKNNVTDLRLRAAIGIDPLTGICTGLIKEVYENLIDFPAIKAAVDRGQLNNARVGTALSRLVKFNLKSRDNYSGNNGVRSLATVNVDTVNGYNPRAVGKRAPHSD